MTDGNTQAIAQYLDEREDYDALQEVTAELEQARAVLPEGLTVSKLYANGTIRSWIHYVELRSANGTQKEHMDLAVAIGKAISEIFPMIDTECN